ncbi:hypothetical protein TNCV_4890881 [Trichonephila clavipes]|nr:hypothetical protein TNCV_4890881 [Trichonephila clavipes]
MKQYNSPDKLQCIFMYFSFNTKLKPLNTKRFPGNEQNAENTSGLDSHIVLLEEFISVDDDNICTVPIMADKDILEFVQSSKNIIDTNYDDENEMNNAAPVPTSSEMRNVMKSKSSYIVAHSNGEMNNKMDDNE